MNRLPVDTVAEERYVQHCRDYSKRLLARADIIARERDGNSMQSGDFDRAQEHLEGRSRKTQLILVLAGAAVGAGLSGIVQSLLDGKPLTYAITFTVLGIGGFLLGLKAMPRK